MQVCCACMTSEHLRHSPQANSKILRLLCIIQLMKCAFSEQITKALPKPLPELLQIVTLTQASAYIIKGQAAPAELSTDVAFGSRCCSFVIVLLYLLSLLPQYLSLTNNMQCRSTAENIHTGCWKDADWHVIQGVQLPCRRHQRAFWLLRVKAHLKTAWALAAHILATEIEKCSDHIALTPSTGSWFALPVFSMPFAGPEGVLNLHSTACRTTIQVMQAPSANLAKL